MQRRAPPPPLALLPPQVTAAIVTCGGLCPGLNDVVQNLVYTLADYGVPEDQILGIRYGLRWGACNHAGAHVEGTWRMHVKGGGGGGY